MAFKKTSIDLNTVETIRRYDYDDYENRYRTKDNGFTFKEHVQHGVLVFYKGVLIHRFDKMNLKDPNYKVEYNENHVFIYSSNGSETWGLTSTDWIQHIVLRTKPLSGKSRDGLFRDKSISWFDFEPAHKLTYHLSNGSSVSELFLEKLWVKERLRSIRSVMAKQKLSKIKSQPILIVDSVDRLFKRTDVKTIVPILSIVRIEYE